MKVLLIVFPFFLFLTACNPNGNQPRKKQVSLTPLQQLKQQKTAIDEYLANDSTNLTVMVKLTNKDKLVKVKKNDWPDSVDYTLNVLKNKSGKIILIAQMPFSESGDWELSYRHYFDKNGRTFFFSKEESIFDESVAGGIVRQTLSRYYNDSFTLIAERNKITDVNDRPVNRKPDEFEFRNNEFKIYPNLADCLIGYHLLKK